MALPELRFVRQEQPDNLLQLCRLVAAEYEQQCRVLLVMADEEKAIALDRYLWVWDKTSFLPHVFDNGTLPTTTEPIVISLQENNSNGASVLIMDRDCASDFLRRFDRVIDFARTYDPHLLDLSRQRFRQYRDAGLNPEMLS